MAVQSSQVDAVSELQNSFRVLFANWTLAVPTALVSLAAAAFFAFMIAGVLATVGAAGMMGGVHPGAAGALLGAGGLGLAVGFIVIVLLSILANATVIGASENVWQGQPADLAGGFSRALSKLGPLILLFFLAIIISIVCGLLVFALGLGLLVGAFLLFFFMYTLPAIVVGNRGATEALGDSWGLVRSNFGPSIIAFLGIVVVTIVGQIIINLFHAIPLLMIVVSFVVGGLTSAYAALVTVRFYDLLSGARRAVVTPPPASTMPRP